MKTAKIMKGIVFVAIPISTILLIAGLYDAFLGTRENMHQIVIGAGGLSGALMLWKNLRSQDNSQNEP